uniref:Uncharacterized protein n=1 Tax=Acrobeloides nanus TaxID=290746 RepID=A0A914CYQ5_9BILA
MMVYYCTQDEMKFLELFLFILKPSEPINVYEKLDIVSFCMSHKVWSTFGNLERTLAGELRLVDDFVDLI